MLAPNHSQPQPWALRLRHRGFPRPIGVDTLRAMAPRRGASRGNWPATQSQLVSREADQRQIEQLVLSGQSRLVSLVGAPGSGKTRLAVMVGESVARAFP